VSAVHDDVDVRIEELLIARIAERLQDLRHVAVGASSPIPGAAALLARQRSDERLRVSILGSRRHTSFTDGGRELFDCAAQGRIDAFFLGGAQIDGQANINLVAIGDYHRPKARFPGCFGSSYLYFLVPNVFLFTMDHSPRVLVPRVDFISAPGFSEAGTYRPGGPQALFTNRCQFDVDPVRRRFCLRTLHPGESEQSIRDNTGFDFDVSPHLAPTPTPGAEVLSLIRGPVAAGIAEVYPGFARRLFG
jgi:glutaconate CoA-transferase subunit B